MKKIIVLFFIALIIQQTVVLAQNNPLIKYLPENASMVMNFNAAGLAAKIPGETFRQSFIYREMMKDPGMPINTLLTSPATSGIDFSAGIFLVMTNEAAGKNPDEVLEGRPEPGVNIFIKLSNAELFTNNMKELLKDKEDPIRTYGTDRILQTGKDMTLGWNNDVLVITSATDRKIKEELKELYSDTTATSQKDYEKTFANITYRQKNAQRNICFSLLVPKPQNSLSTNSRFLNLMNTVADIKTWNSGMSNSLLGGKVMGLLSSSAFSKLMAFAGKTKTSTANFENGKIVMQTSTYPNDEVAAIYKKYPNTILNTELTRRLPKGNILAIINTSYNPQMGIEIMQKSGIKEMLQDLKSPVPFDFNLIASAFGSNMMLAVIKSDETMAVDSITKSMDGIKLIMAMPIANKTKFDELRAAVKQFEDSMQKEKGESKIMKDMKPAIKYTDSLLVISLSPNVAADFINNPGTEPALDWLRAKDQYPMVMAVNMKEILKMAFGKKRSAKNGKEEEMVMNMFDEMIVYGGKYENESLNTTMEFQFTNKTDNALKQLFDMLNLAADKNKQVTNEEAANDDNIKMEDTPAVAIENIPTPPSPPKPIKKATVKPKAKLKSQ
jgi:hypothetical protein